MSGQKEGSERRGEIWRGKCRQEERKREEGEGRREGEYEEGVCSVFEVSDVRLAANHARCQHRTSHSADACGERC